VPPATLEGARSRAEQYRLVTAERELLQNTLMGCVTVLTEVLSVVPRRVQPFVPHQALCSPGGEGPGYAKYVAV